MTRAPPPQYNPIMACWSAVSANASSRLFTAPTTKPLSYRQVKSPHQPLFLGW